MLSWWSDMICFRISFPFIDSCPLIHSGYMTHICVSKLGIIGSDNGLLPGWHQAIIRSNAVILLSGPVGTNFSEILREVHTFSFKKMHLKMWSGKFSLFCFSINVLNTTLEIHFCQKFIATYFFANYWKETLQVCWWRQGVHFILLSSWWHHQMEIFSALLALCEGNPPVDSPHKGQWCRALLFSLIYTWTNGWANNWDNALIMTSL